MQDSSTDVINRDQDRAVDWRARALRTGPADRAVAERGVRTAYVAAGLAEPRAVVWFDSPLLTAAAALLLSGRAGTVREAGTAEGRRCFEEAARILADHGVTPGRGAAGASVREVVRTAPWEAARRRYLSELGPTGWSEHWAATGGELWSRVDELAARVRGAVTDALAGPDDPSRPVDAARSAVRLGLLDGLLGQHDAAWLAALADAPELAGQVEVAGAAGWWWPYTEAVLLTERPVALHQDEAGRLHHADGPALAFVDGFALHAWRGMSVPNDFLQQLAALTPAAIRAEENAELRRVMLESYGYDRYLAESGAQPVHRDETGVLWRIELEGDEPVVMVEVLNSTPEPDGTVRIYWLRVPPRTRTAREGVAWTFGLTEAEYQPLRQT